VSSPLTPPVEGNQDGLEKESPGQTRDFEDLYKRLEALSVPVARPQSAPGSLGNGGPRNPRPPPPSLGGNTPPPQVRLCTNCAGLGHTSAECKVDQLGRPIRGCAPGTPGSGQGLCHRCGKPGHYARRCPAANSGGKPRGSWKAGEIGKSLRDEDAKVRGALDAAKEILSEVPELKDLIRDLEAELVDKEKKDTEDAVETEEQELQTLRDKFNVGGFRITWRESKGDSPLTLGRLAFAGISAAFGGAGFCYFMEVLSVTSRLVHLPAMLFFTPFLKSNITGMSMGKSIFQGCIYGAMATTLMVGVDYYYSAFRGLRTFWAGGVFTDRRKKPIKREVSFLRWGPKCGKDRRPDYAKVVEGEHDPLLAEVEYKKTQGWSVKTRTKMVSMEILSQIAHHANMTHMVSDEISAVKLDQAAGKIATVKFSRYSAHLTTENIVSETARLAHAVRMAQLYRLERDDLPFYRPSSQ